MRSTVVLAGLLLLPIFTGCTAPEALFGVFGDHYSGGGYTRADKAHHFNQQVESSRSGGSWNR